MLSREFALQRICGILAEIRNLKDEDFPYDHALDALEQIEFRVQQRVDLLNSLTEDDEADAVDRVCAESLEQNFKLLPLLGFIVRSTSVRNSFEVFWPLLRLARQILGDDIKLILSSEWWFSPHVYRPVVDLPGYVLLGFPASESSNPLLVPLAGHEFGHTTWQRKGLREKFGKQIQATILANAKARQDKYDEFFTGGLNLPLIVLENLDPAIQCALRQAEETFCDYFGLRLFAVSYLHAFAYLLTPGGSQRVASYPSTQTRVENLVAAARELGMKVPDSYQKLFRNDINRFGQRELFLVELADAATAALKDQLLSEAVAIADRAAVPKHSQDKVDSVKRAFRLLTPCSNVGDLINILTAAWELQGERDIWKEIVTPDDQRETLNELVLKSVEILEFEKRMEHSNGAKS